MIVKKGQNNKIEYLYTKKDIVMEDVEHVYQETCIYTKIHFLISTSLWNL